MESKLKAQMKILKVKEDQLDECNRKVMDLKKQHEKSKKEKKKLTDQIETTEQRLIRAEKLNVGLADEKVFILSPELLLNYPSYTG